MSDEIARYNNRMYARELRRKKREKDTLAFFSDEEVMCAYYRPSSPEDFQ